MRSKKSNLKKKLIVSIVALSLVGGVAVYASLDPGQQLRTWYNKVFLKSAEEVGKSYEIHANAKDTGARGTATNIANQKTNNVNQYGTQEVDRTIRSIHEAKDEYLRSLNSARDAISNEMVARYNNLISDYIERYNERSAKLKIELEQQVATEINNAGQNSANRVRDEGRRATDEAKRALEEAVARAKEQLTLLNRQKQQEAQNTIRNHIDTKINELIASIEQAANVLEENNKTLIKNTADQTIATAKSELDAIVANIDK